MITYSLHFQVGEHVHIDGLTDLKGIVTEISIRHGGQTYEVAWWNERAHLTAWFQPSRLSAVEGRPA